tara:strand:- start:321 stop:1004 length:684 start_codon:yes stop_codon:yes gene_type:complete
MRITQQNLKTLARSRKKWTERQVDQLYQIYKNSHFGAPQFQAPLPRTPIRPRLTPRVSPHWPLSFANGEDVVLASYPNIKGKVIHKNPNNGMYTIRIGNGPMIGDDGFYWHHQLKKTTASENLISQFQFGAPRHPTPPRERRMRRIRWPRFNAHDIVDRVNSNERLIVLHIVQGNINPILVQYRVEVIGSTDGRPINTPIGTHRTLRAHLLRGPILDFAPRMHQHDD